MANTEFNVRIQLKRDTDANWRAKDPQLLAGEMVFVDTNAGEVRTKVGDGTKKYSALPFTDEVLRNLVSDSSKPAFYFEGSIGDNFSFTPTTTVADLNAAYEANRSCYCSFPVNLDGLAVTAILPLKAFNKDTAYLFAGVVTDGSPTYIQVLSSDGGTSWLVFPTDLAQANDIPVNVSQLANDAGYLTSNSANSTYVKKTGDELIKGIKTFESSIVCSMTPGNENHLVNKKYVDNKVGTYLPLAGGDMSGKLTAPKIETGSGDTNYFQSRKFRGEGDAATYYHAIDFGYANHDQVDFHEYGGIWNFFKNTSGKANEGSLCGKITTNGWEGGAKLTGSPTAPTPGTSDNSTRIATTAFVNSFNSTKLESNGDGSNVTAAFTAASSRTNIATGEKLSVLFGKIAKWLSDLGSLAFKSTVAKTDLASDVQTSLGKADSAVNVSVTAADNGKFLRVVNGVWAAATVDNANGVSF